MIKWFDLAPPFNQQLPRFLPNDSILICMPLLALNAALSITVLISICPTLLIQINAPLRNQLFVIYSDNGEPKDYPFVLYHLLKSDLILKVSSIRLLFPYECTIFSNKRPICCYALYIWLLKSNTKLATHPWSRHDNCASFDSSALFSSALKPISIRVT